MTKARPNQYRKSATERDVRLENGAIGPDQVPTVPGAGEFPRRSFLKAAGFALGGAVVTGCSRTPVEKAIPYLLQPEGIIPGKAYFYASTCDGCTAACGLLVKNRDGRPIKLEGNPDHPLSRGGLCARGQASVLGLYDSRRLNQPLRGGEPATWEEVDGDIVEQLNRLRANGGTVRVLSETIHSPTLGKVIEEFLGGFADGRHIVYDPLSSAAILSAHEQTMGRRILPRYRFDRASVVVGLDADFLGTWISPVEYAAGYRQGRRLEEESPRFSYHLQFESRMSLTGSKADARIRVLPSELGLVATHLAERLAARAGIPMSGQATGDLPIAAERLAELVDTLWEARGTSLVVCGSQDVPTQVLCSFINHTLGNYGSTIDIEHTSNQKRGNDGDLEAFISELEQGQVDAVFVRGVNPLFELPGAERLGPLLSSVPLLVSMDVKPNETAELAGYVCPDTHYLESWGDRQPVDGIVSLLQPALEKLGDTRPALESLSVWMGRNDTSYDMVRRHWQETLFEGEENPTAFEPVWDRAVHDGLFASAPDAEPGTGAPEPDLLSETASFNTDAVVPISPAGAADALSLVLYPTIALGEGRDADNPWLHELPDPITKVTWDNYVCLSPGTAREVGVTDGDIVRVVPTAGDEALSMELPVLIQLGQHDQIVAVALGYGGKATLRFDTVGPDWIEKKSSVGSSGLVGVNAAPMLGLVDGLLQYTGTPVSLERTGEYRQLASTQDHHRLEVPEHLALPGIERREIVEETDLESYLASRDRPPQDDETPAEGVVAPAESDVSLAESDEEHDEEHVQLWPDDHPYTGHHWGMAIDLAACTGCSACVVACQVENNIPVVGRDEIRRRRQMHWIRIDRYYSGEDDDPDVAHQPMMCQQCDHAPCETVCPVLATVHSDEGLNQQVYNRCVGTRYCANNCPYKARRFNWFAYAHDDALENMVLNPDVTVRSRGVMEKCTFCVQRIQIAKIEAGDDSAEISDGSIQTACQQSCPADAIVFGDMNDPESRVSHALASPRRYHVLEELNVRPSIGYLRVVRNRDAVEEEE